MYLEIFDPVLCCSTGVCGPQVDPALVRIAADLRWVEENGGSVRRYNLGQTPAAFARNPLVRDELTRGGEAVLPLVLVDGAVALRGRYPDRAQLAAWLKQDGAASYGRNPSDGCGSRDCC